MAIEVCGVGEELTMFCQGKAQNCDGDRGGSLWLAVLCLPIKVAVMRCLATRITVSFGELTVQCSASWNSSYSELRFSCAEVDMASGLSSELFCMYSAEDCR